MTTTGKSWLSRAGALAACLALGGVVLYASLALDQLVWRHVHVEDALRRDWARLFRVTGYVPMWVLAGLALWMLDAGGGSSESKAGARTRGWLSWVAVRRGLWVVANAAASGLLAEAIKIAVRRERPGEMGEVVFRAWEGAWWKTGGLGFTSSHVGVSAGAACALICLFPRAWAVWVLLPVGCAVTRLMDRAHFLSDCVGAGLGAVIVCAGLMAVFRAVSRRA